MLFANLSGEAKTQMCKKSGESCFLMRTMLQVFDVGLQPACHNRLEPLITLLMLCIKAAV